MTRIIKFRCRNTEKKELNYDPIAYINDGSINSTFEEADIEDNIFMAYTGLNDKLGNPIYDLDILRKPTGTIDGKQNYRYEIVKEHNITVNDWGIIIGGFEFNDDIDDYELWGNIYENKYPGTFNFESPELLNN